MLSVHAAIRQKLQLHIGLWQNFNTLLKIFGVTHTECTLGYDEFVINSRRDALS